jgi:hypothetical protein
MSKMAGGDCIVQFDNASNALQDVSSSIETIAMPLTVNGGQFHVLNDRWGKAMEGGIMGTVSITYYNDNSPTSFAGYVREWALHASSKGGARSLRVQTPDGSAGSIQYDCEVKLGGEAQIVNAAAGSGDPQKLSLTLTIDGAVTDSVIGS